MTHGVADLCAPGDIRGIGKSRPCSRVLMCGKCDRPLVANPPTCGECSYCVRLAERAEARRKSRRVETYAGL